MNYVGLHIEFEDPQNHAIGGGGTCVDWYGDPFQKTLLVQSHDGVKHVPVSWVKNMWK